MDVTQAETLADQICGCANREQHRRDVALLNEAFAAYRQAALLEGMRIGLEAGAQESADYLNGDDFDSRDCDIVLPERIMRLDPAAVLARHGGA